MRAAVYLGALLLAAFGATANAAPLTLTYDSYSENKTLETMLAASTPLRLDGLMPDRGGGSVVQTLTFIAGSTDLSMSAGWRIAPTGVRMVGVNIDLFDAASTVVFSDTFGGVNSGLAQSQFLASGLTVGGEYTLMLTGTAIQGGRYQIDLATGGGPLAIPPVPVVATSADHALFDTLKDDKVLGSIDPGDMLVLDGIIGESGAITNVAELTLTGGALSAGITWLIAPGDQRTVGVNVDLLDATNTVVASDTFEGIFSGQAFSNFALDGLVGNYRLVFTGNALQGGRYRINLGTSLTPPDFMPIPTGGVPEPQTWALLVAGFAGVGVAMRRRRASHAKDEQRYN